MNLLLLAGSTVALALVVFHSWRTRGKSVTLAFFLSALAFGILRGNAIWLLCKLLAADAAGALKPYVAEGGLLPEIGHDSLQVALGWVFSMYLAWTVSELILRRLPRLAGRVFMIAGLASLFMLAACYVMETAAPVVGWWRWWAIPTGTALFGSVNTPAMEGWFSVVPDFLIPFLVIACAATTRGRLKWLWTLAFPLHLLGHLMYRWAPMAYLAYNAMELLVVALMMFSRLRMGRGEVRETPGDRASGPALAAALVLFFGVVLAALAAAGGGAEKMLAVVPMMMLCALAWRRIPAWGVAVLSAAALAGWTWQGPRALWATAPVVAFGFLRVLDRRREPSWMKAIPPAAVVALAAWAAVLFEADRERTSRFEDAWLAGDIATFDGRPDDAAKEYARAERERPRELGNYYLAVRDMMEVRAESPEMAARVLAHRVPRITRELELASRRDEDYVPVRQDLARFDLIEGRVTDAAAQYRAIARLRPKDPDTLVMLAYLLLRAGETRDAESACEAALRLRRPPPEAMVDLGVLRFSEGKVDEARKLWEEAMKLRPKLTAAGLNLARATEPESGRAIDARFLARPSDGAALAPWVYSIARHVPEIPPGERLRLYAESAQLDPDFLEAHLGLVETYLARPDGAALALWHARRTVDIARASGNKTEQAQGLLALACALAANGRADEARRAAEEGRPLAPAAEVPRFDRFLRGLAPTSP